jgi:hypothetical protein
MDSVPRTPDDREDEPEGVYIPDAVADQPPSAKLVYVILAYEGPCAQAELAERSNIPQRTVRFAGTRLQDETDVLESRNS